jgi:hypothetical protein
MESSQLGSQLNVSILEIRNLPVSKASMKAGKVESSIQTISRNARIE